MHLIFPKNHPLARKKSVTLADTAAFRLILHARSVAARRVIDAGFHANGIVIENILEVGTCDAIKEFVRLGLGIGFVHDICLPEETEEIIDARDMSGKIDTIEVSLIHKKSTFRKPSYRALIESLVASRGTSLR
jgi:DNA-binding transcriptional LysR family regulator